MLSFQLVCKANNGFVADTVKMRGLDFVITLGRAA
jgi:hypothetical protein